jgi:hypothetical protein
MSDFVSQNRTEKTEIIIQNAALGKMLSVSRLISE